VQLAQCNGSTSSMHKHLEKKHPNEYMSLEKSSKIRKILDKDIQEQPTIRGPMNLHVSCVKNFEKYKLDSEPQKKIDVLIMTAIARGNLSFNTVNEDWFKE